MIKRPSKEKFIAERIIALCANHHLSEYQLSISLGFSKGYIQSITAGTILPSVNALYNICDYFGITLMDFFTETSEEKKLHQDLRDAIRDLSAEEQIMLYHFLKKDRIPETPKKRRRRKPAAK